jgi:hypothetical protein
MFQARLLRSLGRSLGKDPTPKEPEAFGVKYIRLWETSDTAASAFAKTVSHAITPEEMERLQEMFTNYCVKNKSQAKKGFSDRMSKALFIFFITEAGILDNKINQTTLDELCDNVLKDATAIELGLTFDDFYEALCQLSMKKLPHSRSHREAISRLLVEFIFPNVQLRGNSAQNSSLMNSEVISQFRRYDAALRRIFRYYAAQEHVAGLAISWSEMVAANETICLTEFLQFVREYNIYPTFIEKSQVGQIFREANRGAFADDNPDELSYPEFIEALVNTATCCYPNESDIRAVEMMMKNFEEPFKRKFFHTMAQEGMEERPAHRKGSGDNGLAADFDFAGAEKQLQWGEVLLGANKTVGTIDDIKYDEIPKGERRRLRALVLKWSKIGAKALSFESSQEDATVFMGQAEFSRAMMEAGIASTSKLADGAFLMYATTRTHAHGLSISEPGIVKALGTLAADKWPHLTLYESFVQGLSTWYETVLSPELLDESQLQLQSRHQVTEASSTVGGVGNRAFLGILRRDVSCGRVMRGTAVVAEIKNQPGYIKKSFRETGCIHHGSLNGRYATESQWQKQHALVTHRNFTATLYHPRHAERVEDALSFSVTWNQLIQRLLTDGFDILPFYSDVGDTPSWLRDADLGPRRLWRLTYRSYPGVVGALVDVAGGCGTLEWQSLEVKHPEASLCCYISEKTNPKIVMAVMQAFIGTSCQESLRRELMARGFKLESVLL